MLKGLTLHSSIQVYREEREEFVKCRRAIYGNSVLNELRIGRTKKEFGNAKPK
jgi:hypothetical protein